jgi:hypothetical protein
MTPCADYVLSSRLDILFHSAGKSTADGFNLRRLDVEDGRGDAGSCSSTPSAEEPPPTGSPCGRFRRR